MLRCAVSRYARLGAAIALSFAVGAGPTMAQVQQPAPPLPGGVPPAERMTGMLEGAVKKVDRAAGTLQVSLGPFGILGKILEVTPDTQIQIEGRQATLADIREGGRVKASYEETREGKNVATRIEIMPTQQGEKGGADRAPGKSQ